MTSFFPSHVNTTMVCAPFHNFDCADIVKEQCTAIEDVMSDECDDARSAASAVITLAEVVTLLAVTTFAAVRIARCVAEKRYGQPRSSDILLLSQDADDDFETGNTVRSVPRPLRIARKVYSYVVPNELLGLLVVAGGGLEYARQQLPYNVCDGIVSEVSPTCVKFIGEACSRMSDELPEMCAGFLNRLLQQPAGGLAE
jgi:hypothetical protein